MITSLIDFSFLRSVVVRRYSPYGPPCYDPVSLFLLDLFRYIDGHLYMTHFFLYSAMFPVVVPIKPMPASLIVYRVRQLSPIFMPMLAKHFIMKSFMYWLIFFTT